MLILTRYWAHLEDYKVRCGPVNETKARVAKVAKSKVHMVGF